MSLGDGWYALMRLSGNRRVTPIHTCGDPADLQSKTSTRDIYSAPADALALDGKWLAQLPARLGSGRSRQTGESPVPPEENRYPVVKRLAKGFSGSLGKVMDLRLCGKK